MLPEEHHRFGGEGHQASDIMEEEAEEMKKRG